MIATQAPEAITSRRDLALLLVVTGLALALRLAGLGHESIWYDEAASLDMARASALDLLTGRKLDNGNPAGYFLLLHFWLQWLGATIENARALSAIAGTLSVPAVWLLARSYGLSRLTGLLAGLLVAVSPPLVYLSQEARTFALFATVATFAAAAVARAERGGGFLAWASFAATGAVLVHLHYYGAFVLAALGTHLLVWAWLHNRTDILKLAGCAVVVLLAFVPWLPVFRVQLSLGASRSDDTWWQHLALMPLFSTAGRTLVWKEVGLKTVAGVDLTIAALVFVPLALLLWKVKPRPGLPLAFVAGVPLLAALVSTRTPMIHSHYLAVVFPALCLLIACGLEAGWQRGPKALALVPTVVLTVVMLVALIRMYILPHKTDWRGVAQLVGRDGGELPVYFYEDIGADPFAYYRPSQPLHRVTEHFGDNGSGWRKERTEMDAAQDGFWFVLYPTGAATRAEEPALTVWLDKEFEVVKREDFPPMRVWLCKPRAATNGSTRYEGQQGIHP
jgi:mannosyltransferase